MILILRLIVLLQLDLIIGVGTEEGGIGVLGLELVDLFKVFCSRR